MARHRVDHLTERQEHIVAFIRERIAEHGEAPTVVEIGEGSAAAPLCPSSRRAGEKMVDFEATADPRSSLCQVAISEPGGH